VTKRDQHDVVAEIVRLSQELGRAPTYSEVKVGLQIGSSAIQRLGGLQSLLAAAGLEMVSKQSQKIDRSVFNRSLDRHLEQIDQRPAVREPYETCLFIPDTHFPFHHRPTIERIIAWAQEHRPKHIVQVGDLYDMYSSARFPRSHNVFTPRDESRLGREAAEQMWKRLIEVSPGSRCVQMVGNHDVRPLKQILDHFPQAEDWISKMLKEHMTFPGVELIFDSREELRLPGEVMVHHGYRSRLGEHRDFTLTNMVCGHQHVGGVVFKQIKGRVLWELNCGLAGDPFAKGLTYTPQKTTHWTLGFGYLDEHGPRFIPC